MNARTGTSTCGEGHVAAAVGYQVPEGLELSWIPGSAGRALESVEIGRLGDRLWLKTFMLVHIG